MIDRLKNTSIHDIAFAESIGMDIIEVEKSDLLKQKNEMQNMAFKMKNNRTTITQENADELNKKYQEIVSILECEYDEDLMCDYWIDFNSFVPSNSYYNKFSY